MNYIICLVSNVLNYEKYFINNVHLQTDNIVIVPKIHKSNSVPSGKIYNMFLDELPDDAVWLIFTHDFLEFVDDPFQHLKCLPKDELYGVWGAQLAVNQNGRLLQECLGKISIKESPDISPYYFYNAITDEEEMVTAETIDSICLIASAQSIHNCNLRFDEKLNFLYAEDFCLQAFDNHNISSKIIALDCCTHGPLFQSKETLEQDILHCAAKYANKHPRAGIQYIFGNEPSQGERVFMRGMPQKDDSKIYHREVGNDDYNLPIVVASKMLQDNTCILDCGCACGDNGLYLAKSFKSELYGMEYNKQSIYHARKLGIYKKIHHIDLNNFLPHSYSQYYHFFDNILLLDVIEHLYSPFEVLQKLSSFLNESGSFIISLPNLAHAYPILNLLDHEFQYQDFGILDSTHIRFFTLKSLATSLAQWKFKIIENSVTFVCPDTRGMLTPKSLPQPFYDHMWSDPHFLVCQYVCSIQPSNDTFKSLKRHNRDLLEQSVQNNPEGQQAVTRELPLFQEKVALFQGRGVSELKKHQLTRLCAEKEYIKAILLSGFFDEGWYRKTYSEIDFTNAHPLEDYLTQGWKAGRNPGEAFNTIWYLTQYPTALQSGICPLLFHLIIGLMAGLPYNKNCLTIPDKELVGYAKHVLTLEEDYSNTFVPYDVESYVREATDPKLIAFYLPQFAPFPENDRWWGKGFTEWTNVTKAVPQFDGHYQPRLPYDLGFYDLRVKEVAIRQEELAQHYGIFGFCYHYYWFGGKKIMQKPIEAKLKDPNLRLPFCISWANESWSANWDGSRNNLLIDQPPQIKTDLLFQDLLPFFNDERYIKIDGKPFFMVYRPAFFSLNVMQNLIDDLQNLALHHGLPGLHIVLGNTFRKNQRALPLQKYGADAFIEFPPHKLTTIDTHDVAICNKKFIGKIYNLPDSINFYKKKDEPSDLTYRTVFPMWDNTSRKAECGAIIFKNTSPDIYLDWLIYCIRKTMTSPLNEQNLVFINAWNEWAEAAYLEPDRKYGYAYLSMTKRAIHETRKNKTPASSHE